MKSSQRLGPGDCGQLERRASEVILRHDTVAPVQLVGNPFECLIEQLGIRTTSGRQRVHHLDIAEPSRPRDRLGSDVACGAAAVVVRADTNPLTELRMLTVPAEHDLAGSGLDNEPAIVVLGAHERVDLLPTPPTSELLDLQLDGPGKNVGVRQTEALLRVAIAHAQELQRRSAALGHLDRIDAHPPDAIDDVLLLLGTPNSKPGHDAAGLLRILDRGRAVDAAGGRRLHLQATEVGRKRDGHDPGLRETACRVSAHLDRLQRGWIADVLSGLPQLPQGGRGARRGARTPEPVGTVRAQMLQVERIAGNGPVHFDSDEQGPPDRAG